MPWWHKPIPSLWYFYHASILQTLSVPRWAIIVIKSQNRDQMERYWCFGNPIQQLIAAVSASSILVTLLFIKYNLHYCLLPAGDWSSIDKSGFQADQHSSHIFTLKFRWQEFAIRCCCYDTVRTTVCTKLAATWFMCRIIYRIYMAYCVSKECACVVVVILVSSRFQACESFRLDLIPWVELTGVK